MSSSLIYEFIDASELIDNIITFEGVESISLSMNLDYNLYSIEIIPDIVYIQSLYSIPLIDDKTKSNFTYSGTSVYPSPDIPVNMSFLIKYKSKYYVIKRTSTANNGLSVDINNAIGENITWSWDMNTLMENLSEILSCKKPISSNELFQISKNKFFSYTVTNAIGTYPVHNTTHTEQLDFYLIYGDIVNTNTTYSYQPTLKIRAKSLGTNAPTIDRFFTNGVPKYISIEGYGPNNKIKIFNGEFSNANGSSYYVGDNVVNQSNDLITTKNGSELSTQFSTAAIPVKNYDSLFKETPPEKLENGIGYTNPFNPGITPKSYTMNMYRNYDKKELYTIADYYSYDKYQIGLDSYGRG